MDSATNSNYIYYDSWFRFKCVIFKFSQISYLRRTCTHVFHAHSMLEILLWIRKQITSLLTCIVTTIITVYSRLVCNMDVKLRIGIVIPSSPQELSSLLRVVYVTLMKRFIVIVRVILTSCDAQRLVDLKLQDVCHEISVMLQCVFSFFGKHIWKYRCLSCQSYDLRYIYFDWQIGILSSPYNDDWICPLKILSSFWI
jgi:hypothetical protein